VEGKAPWHVSSQTAKQPLKEQAPHSKAALQVSGSCQHFLSCTKTRTHSVAPSSLQELSTAQHPLQSTVPAHSKSVPVQKTFESHLSTLQVTNNGGPRTLNKL
jgi:hypothetical protein